MSAPIRLLLVDDHPTVRDGLRGIFADDPEITVVSEAAGGAEALDVVSHETEDIVLMDLRMSGMSGVEANRQLQHHSPGTHVLVLTIYDTEAVLLPKSEYGFILLANANSASSAFVGYAEIKRGLIALLLGRTPTTGPINVGVIGVLMGMVTLLGGGQALNQPQTMHASGKLNMVRRIQLAEQLSAHQTDWLLERGVGVAGQR